MNSMETRGGSCARAVCVLAAGLSAFLVPAGLPARAEVIEEVVAVVDGEAITKSQFEEEEQALLSEAYRRFTGQELDRQVEAIRKTVLSQLIDRKVLMHRAARLFDLSGYEKMLLEQFKSNQKVETDEQLEQLLAGQGMTIDDLKQRLIEQVAPRQIIDMEVGGRVACSDKEIEEYYQENLDQFKVKAKFHVREIVLLADDGNREEKRKLAEEIREKAMAPGGDFQALAKEYSDAGTREAGGDLGDLEAGDLSPVLEKVALETPVGAVSESLETDYGFHVLQVVSREDTKTLSLDEARDRIRTFLENTQYFEKLQAFLKKIREESDIQIRPKYKDRYHVEGT